MIRQIIHTYMYIFFLDINLISHLLKINVSFYVSDAMGKWNFSRAMSTSSVSVIGLRRFFRNVKVSYQRCVQFNYRN